MNNASAINIVKSCLCDFNLSGTEIGRFFSLKKLAACGFEQVLKLPMSLKVMLESLLRHYDNDIVTIEHILDLINWVPGRGTANEIPFFVSRVILQDYSGLPLLNDMSAMRMVVTELGKSALMINPMVPTCLVIDHSIEAYYTRRKDALQLNMNIELQQNSERYEFLKWAATAFKNLEIIPPGSGIIHQINLEYLAKGISHDSFFTYYPETIIGTDSHTTMSNGLGIVGWGVGGIEASSAMLGIPMFLTVPDVVGVHLTGELKSGVTTTDLVLTITEILRKAKVTGKIIEYFGCGVSSLTAQERATIANMAPEYGAMMGLFPVDEKTIQYYKETGRKDDSILEILNYYKAQEWFGVPELGDSNYGSIIEIDLLTICSSIAGPKRPQDRINLSYAKSAFEEILTRSEANDGYGYPPCALKETFKLYDRDETLSHGDIIIAAITSCTNTSNPYLLITAGLLAKNAYQRGLRVKPHITTSLSPGSKTVIAYLEKSGLLEYLEKLGFFLTGYGCSTCVGNVGKLDSELEKLIKENNLVVTSVLSGNRNFESRIHPSVRANFLMSPPLVIAFAIAGTIKIDLLENSLGLDLSGKPVFLKDIWPSAAEIEENLCYSKDPKIYRDTYNSVKTSNPSWNFMCTKKHDLYYSSPSSNFIINPPFFEDFSVNPPRLEDILNARILLILGDSITTDHISPVGKIEESSPAGQYLLEQGVLPRDFGNYGVRRGNHEVMLRGIFSNARLKNKMLDNIEGAYTINGLTKQKSSIYETAVEYKNAGISSVIFAGEEYGCGSARDWAAKGLKLLGVKVVIANSFERIHRSNLVGMGILPCQLKDHLKIEQLELSGMESIDILGIKSIAYKKELTLIIKSPIKDNVKTISIIPQLENKIELEYIYHGGVMPYVLRNLIMKQESIENENYK